MRMTETQIQIVQGYRLQNPPPGWPARVLKGDVLALFDKDMVPWLGYSYEINNRGMKLYAIDKDFKREKLLYVFMKL